VNGVDWSEGSKNLSIIQLPQDHIGYLLKKYRQTRSSIIVCIFKKGRKPRLLEVK